MIDPRNIEVIDDAYAAMLRTIPGVERVRIASRMYAFARESMLHHLRTIHPDWSESQVRTEAIWRLTGVAVRAI